MPRGRKTLFKNEIIRESERMASYGLTECQIAHVFGVSPFTLSKWKNKKPEFQQALNRGETLANSIVQKSLFKRAIGFTYNEIVRERVGKSSSHKARHKKEDGFSLTEEQWEQCLIYFNNVCAYCESDQEIQKDHFYPLAKGGGFVVDNIVPACKSCNSGKKDHEAESWYVKQNFFDPSKLELIKNYFQSVSLEDGTSMKVTKIITKLVPSETTAAIFWLKNKAKDVWRDVHDYRGEGFGGTTINIHPNKTIVFRDIGSSNACEGAESNRLEETV